MMEKEMLLEKYSKLIMQLFLGFLIVFSLILPSMYQSIKILLWIPIIISTWILQKEICIPKQATIWVIIYTITNLFYMILGYYNGSTEVFKFYTVVHLIAPWVYYFILINPTQIIKNSFFEFVLRIAFYLINIFIIVSILLYKIDLFPDTIKIEAIGLVIDDAGGYMSYYVPSITPLFFLIPFFVSKVLLAFSNKNIDKFDVIDTMFIIVSFVNSILIGRRMLMVIILLSVFLVLAFNYMTNRSVSKKLIAILLVVGILFVVLYFVSNLFGWELRFSADFFVSGNNERISQIQSLLSDWLNAPVFGYGIGMNTSVVRSNVPGMYEMSYFAMLFQLGIVGFAIKMILFFWIGFNLYKAAVKTDHKCSDSCFFKSLLVAYISLMIANATNPYLESYDFLLFLMLPLAVVSKFLEVNNESSNLHGNL